MEPVKKILWIDDDINRLALMPYIDEFQDRGYTIDRAEDPDEYNTLASQNYHQSGMPVCIIVDVSLPLGESIDSGEAKHGLQTGLVVLKKIMADPQLADVQKIVFTIVDNADVREYCSEHNIPYLEKQQFLADTFVNEVEKIILAKNTGDEQ